MNKFETLSRLDMRRIRGGEGSADPAGDDPGGEKSSSGDHTPAGDGGKKEEGKGEQVKDPTALLAKNTELLAELKALKEKSKLTADDAAKWAEHQKKTKEAEMTAEQKLAEKEKEYSALLDNLKAANLSSQLSTLGVPVDLVQDAAKILVSEIKFDGMTPDKDSITEALKKRPSLLAKSSGGVKVQNAKLEEGQADLPDWIKNRPTLADLVKPKK